MKTITNQLENENNFLKSQLEKSLAEIQKLKTDARVENMKMAIQI